MRRFLTLTIGCLALLGMTALVSACGDDEETTTTEVETTTAEETTTETEPTTTPTTTGTATGTGTTTTGTTTAGQDCGPGEVYSSSLGECVNEREGKNPCPNGEVPMADEPVCVPKD
jgi:hypothetical protein